MPSRRDALARFYARNADELFRAVRHAISGPNELVEDACAYAWSRLVEHHEVSLGRGGFAWLYVVAIREAYRLSDRSRREWPAGSADELPRPRTTDEPDGWQIFEREMGRRERVAILRELSPRKRELVLLHAAGFTYAEIARLTGDSLRTVERQLLRGKRRLRVLAASRGAR